MLSFKKKGIAKLYQKISDFWRAKFLLSMMAPVNQTMNVCHCPKIFLSWV